MRPRIVEDVRKWRLLIQQIRTETEILGEYLKLTELIFIAYCVILLTMTLFLVTVVPFDNPERRSILIIWSYFSSVQFGRLFFKLSWADRIFHEVPHFSTL